MMRDVMIQLLLEKPYYGYIAAKVSFVEDEKIARTQMTYDKKPIINYNPSWFQDLDEQKRRGVVMHELLHIGLLHPFRRENRKEDLWLLACDIAVNEFLDENQRLKDSVTRFTISRELSLDMEDHRSAEYYYEELLGEDDRIDFTYQNKRRFIEFTSQQSFSIESFEEIDKRDLDAKALMEELVMIQSMSREEGVMEGPIGELTDQVYKPYKNDWRHLLKLFLSGQGRIQRTKTYKRQSRRFEDMPGKRRSLGMRALVAIDESGSVSNEDVVAFHHELSRINHIAGTDILVTRFDTECSTPVSLKEFLSVQERMRKGGTDFRPIFELADQERMPVVIIFTDGQGTAPEFVNQKVLWVLIGKGKAPVDYGTEVHVYESDA